MIYNLLYNAIYNVMYNVFYNVIYKVIVIPSSTTFPYLQKRTTENTIEESRNVILILWLKHWNYLTMSAREHSRDCYI